MRKTLVVWIGLITGIVCLSFSSNWAQAVSVSLQVPAETPTIQGEKPLVGIDQTAIPLPFEASLNGSLPLSPTDQSVQALFANPEFNAWGTIPPSPGIGPVVYVGATGYLSLLNLSHPSLPFWQISALSTATTPTWSHSSTRVAFSAIGADGTRCLYTLDLTSLQPATQLQCGFDEILYPSWSPNDTHIVFFGHQTGVTNRAWVTDSADGATLSEVGPDLIQSRYPVWLDNDRVVFPADKTGRTWAIHVASISAPTQPQPLPGEIKCPTGCSCNPASEPLMAYPDVSPNGEKIGFVAVSQTAGCNYAATVYQMPADGSSQPSPVVDVTGGNGSYGWLRWASDNQRAALISTASDGKGRVRLVDMTTGGMQTLERPLAVPNRLEWAPDDAHLTVGFGDSATNSAVYTVDPSTGSFTILAAGKMPDWAQPVLKFDKTVSGRVIDTAGSPLAGVVVTSGSSLSTTSNTDGYYTITYLITGTHTLAAGKPGYVFSPTIRTFTVPPNASEQNFIGTIENGLLAYYSFDDGTATDNSGNGYHGTIYGATRVVGGVFGSALAFNGQNAAVKTPANLEQSSSSAGATLVAWVYPTSVSGGRHHVVSSDNGGFDWSILRDGDTWFVFTGEQSRSTNFKVDLNQWQHVAAVFTPTGEVKFYKNGQLMTMPYINFDASDNNIGIGHNPGYGEYFSGTIDEVRIYNRPLDESEIQAFYQYGYRISGQIKDANGNPLPGVTVSTSAGGSATTNATGIYTLTNLLTGTYSITPTKLGFAFSPPVRTLAVPPHAAAQDFIGAPIPVTNMNGIFYNLNAHAGGNVAVELALQPTYALGHINFTELPSDPQPLCGAGDFSGSRNGNALSLSFVSQDQDPDCGFDHNALFTMAANTEGDGYLWGNYRSQNADGSNIAEYPGVFEAWTAGNQPQPQSYTGVFTDTSRNVRGTVTLNLAIGAHTVAGNMNFSGLSGAPTFCGAGEFTGVNQGTAVEYSFVNTDADLGCSPNVQTRFFIDADLPQNGISLKGTYSTSNNQRGVFNMRSASSTSFLISGRVLDFGSNNGNRVGIPSIQVWLFNKLSSLPMATEFTDQNGNYSFHNIPPNIYRVIVEDFSGTYDFSPASSVEVTVDSDKLNLNFEEKPAFPCSNIVDGICVYIDKGKYHVAKIDLSNTDIRLQLAKDFADEHIGTFNLNTAKAFAEDSSVAGNNRPYIAINATAKRSRSGPTQSSGSILGIQGTIYGERGACGLTTNQTECIDDFGAGFFVYTTDGKSKIFVEGRDGFNIQDQVAAERYIVNQVGTANVDFAIGYRNTILDAVEPLRGTLISGFPEYIAPNDGGSPEHQDVDNRTVIGTSCNDTSFIFIATVFDTTPTARLARDLYKRGACHVIMLDGGGSSQFAGISQNRQVLSSAAFDAGCWIGRNPVRCNINAIVAYNKNQFLANVANVQANLGGEFTLSSNVDIAFIANTFGEDVSVEYSPIPPHNVEGYAHINQFYDINAFANGITIEPMFPYTVSIAYNEHEIPPGINEELISLYYWDLAQNMWVEESSARVYADNNLIIATPVHFSQWALLLDLEVAPNHGIFLPLITR